MIAALLAATLAAGSPAAPAAGFTAAGLAAATPARPAAPAGALSRMELLRLALALDPAAYARLGAMEQRALTAAVGRLDGGNAAPLAWFMRSATLRMTTRRGRPVAGFYNPLVDAWLVTDLAALDGRYQITAARLVDGASVRGGGAIWTAAAQNPFASLVEQHGASLAAFEGDRAYAGGDAFGAVAERTTGWMASLGRWRADAGSAAAAQRVCDAIADGRLAKAGVAAAGVATQVDGLPAALRRSFAVTGAVQRGDAVSVLIASPVRPGLILVLDLDADRRPTGLTVVNLGNAT